MKNKWIAIIGVVICIVLYGAIVGIKYLCSGKSGEGRVIQPGEFSVKGSRTQEVLP